MNVPSFVSGYYLIQLPTDALIACLVFRPLLRGWSAEMTMEFLAKTAVRVALLPNLFPSIVTGMDSFSLGFHRGQVMSPLYRSLAAKELICYPSLRL